jgi:hypothetical protein
MDWKNFAAHGCNGHFFRQPPDDSRRFSDVEGTNKIVPWGWRYYNLPGGEAYSYAMLTENASDVGKSIVGGSGYSFDLLGIAFNHNETIETETKNVVNTKKVRSYFTHTQRAHSIIVDARNIRMGQCFIKDVMRATFALTNTLPEPPRWFDEDDSEDGRCDQTLTDGISPRELIDNYGTHYAYAITLGSRLIRWANITAEDVGTFASKKTDVRDSLDYHFKANLSAPGVPISMEGTAKAGLTGTSGDSSWNNIQKNVETDASYYACAGGVECADASAHTANDPVPIYLDLRPMTDLLGPPYFLDPMVNITLRRAVQAELDKMMVQPVDDFPLLRIFDVNITSLNCDLVNYGITPLPHAATMSQTGQGPFAPGGPFAARTDLVPYMALGITTLAQAKNSFNRACDTLTNTAVLQAEGVLPNGQTGLMSVSGHPLLKNLLAGRNQPGMVIRTPFLTGPGFKFHFRLRKRADQDLDTCPAPCAVEVPGSDPQFAGFATKPPTATAGSLPYYLVYPQFEYLGLDHITPGTNVLNRVVGRGVSNYLLYDQTTQTFPPSTLPPVGYTVLILGTITPKDLAAELGY